MRPQSTPPSLSPSPAKESAASFPADTLPALSRVKFAVGRRACARLYVDLLALAVLPARCHSSNRIPAIVSFAHEAVTPSQSLQHCRPQFLSLSMTLLSARLEYSFLASKPVLRLQN
eukprot:4753266-Pleurochrysis_carterae.AAC.1